MRHKRRGLAVARDVTAPVAYVEAPATYVSGTFDVQWALLTLRQAHHPAQGKWAQAPTASTTCRAPSPLACPTGRHV